MIQNTIEGCSVIDMSTKHQIKYYKTFPMSINEILSLYITSKYNDINNKY